MSKEKIVRIILVAFVAWMFFSLTMGCKLNIVS